MIPSSLLIFNAVAALAFLGTIVAVGLVLRRRMRMEKEIIGALAALLRATKHRQIRNAHRIGSGQWSLQGKFRHRTFLVYKLDRKNGGIGRTRCVIRLEQPPLQRHGDLVLDMRPRSCFTFFGQMLGRPFVSFSNDLLNKKLAFHCSDVLWAKKMCNLEEYRDALFSFWAIGRHRGTIHFAGGILSYAFQWRTYKGVTEEIHDALNLLCDISDLIRSRSWHPFEPQLSAATLT
ncbi:MAG: hypothetical protein LBC42_00750 [Puniceicoccales bacterium]|jgi:hypothetical protein|nr:hypothetical protein [Puniceicoccales bacterium]